MAALCNRGAIIFLPCSFFPSFYLLLLSFFSSPNLSGRRSDVCHTSTLLRPARHQTRARPGWIQGATRPQKRVQQSTSWRRTRCGLPTSGGIIGLVVNLPVNLRSCCSQLTLAIPPLVIPPAGRLGWNGRTSARGQSVGIGHTVRLFSSMSKRSSATLNKVRKANALVLRYCIHGYIVVENGSISTAFALSEDSTRATQKWTTPLTTYSLACRIRAIPRACPNYRPTPAPYCQLATNRTILWRWKTTKGH